MSYTRVIPRDLFNEAKLLKCLGALYIASERRTDLTVDNEDMGQNEPFEICMDPSSGDLFVSNVHVVFRGEGIHCFAKYSSKAPYPLVAEYNNETAYVFTDAGELSEEFLDLVPLRPQTKKGGTQ